MVAVVVVAVVVVAVVVALAFPALAASPTVEGQAVGLEVTSSLPGFAPVALPPGIAAAATAPAAGFGPVRASAALAGLPGLAAAGQTNASTVGSVASASVASASVTSTAELTGSSIAGGLIVVGHAATSCQATAGAATGSTSIDGVSLGGVAVKPNPAPNTVVALPGVLRAVLNEQISGSQGGTASVVVRAIDVQLLPTSADEATLDVVVAESRCAVAGGGAGGGGGGGGGGATTTSSVTPRRPLPPFGAPNSIGSPFPSSTTSPSTSPAGISSGGTSAPGGGAAVPGARGPTPATLTVSTSDGTAVGRPGVALRVVGSGYQGCAKIVVYFDHTRIGTAVPDPSGGLVDNGLAVPGEAGPGAHRVVADCQPASRQPPASSEFRVTAASLHRSAFVTSVPEPGQVATGIKRLAVSAGITLAVILTVAFPSELFNSTLDENYDEVRGWFGLAPRDAGSDPPGHQFFVFVGFVIITGVLYSGLSPDFGFNRSSLALALGFCVSLLVVTIAFRLPSLFVVHRRYREWAQLRVLPGTAVVAAACVVLSRVLHFQPGYLYGLIAGLSLRHQLAKDTTGRLTSAAALGILAISVLAWFGRAPLAAAAGRPNAGFWVVAAEASLATLFVVGLESIAISLIPLRFLEGGKLTAWSRAVWVAVFGLGVFAFVHILLQPTSGYVADTAGASKIVVIALFVAFGLFSVAFWAYFRFRPARSELRSV